MAGLGRKTWSAGEVATAANIQGYLQDQTVMKFANTSAAGSALGTAVSEGMTAYLSDTDEQVMYNGTSWFKQNGTTNAIINGAFDIWQRGTSFTSIANALTYLADRWCVYPPAGVMSASQQASGLTGFRYGMRYQRIAGQTSTANQNLACSLDSATSIPLAGQTVTFSFYAKAGADYSATSKILISTISSGTGTDQNTIIGFTGNAQTAQNNTLTTSYQRFSMTYVVPANATQLAVSFTFAPTGTAGANDWFEVTGVQLEAGSVATPFKRNAASIQAELAACQRYYIRWNGADGANSTIGFGMAANTTAARFSIPLPVQMRTNVAAVEYSSLAAVDINSGTAVTSLIIVGSGYDNNKNATVGIGVASGLTANRPYFLNINNNSAGYIGFSAEL